MDDVVFCSCLPAGRQWCHVVWTCSALALAVPKNDMNITGEAFKKTVFVIKHSFSIKSMRILLGVEY